MNSGQRTADSERTRDAARREIRASGTVFAPSAVRRSPFTARAALALLVALGAMAPARAEAAAERIVSLAPNLTELAFTAGVGDRVVGAVEYSDYPEAARRIPRVGDAFRVDLERVLALEPDLVLAWESGTPVQMLDRLRALGLSVKLIETRRLSDVATALRTIGEAAGAPRQAESAAAAFERQIELLRAEYRERTPVDVFIQVNDQPLYTVNGRHIMSEVVELCGGRNVFATLNDLAPTIGIEAVIAANPDVILATDEGVPDAQSYWRPWKHVEAVRRGNVYSISSDRVARATTRLVEGVRQVCRTLDDARRRRLTASSGSGCRL